jgi:hypothetical protein
MVLKEGRYFTSKGTEDLHLRKEIIDKTDLPQKGKSKTDQG